MGSALSEQAVGGARSAKGFMRAARRWMRRLLFGNGLAGLPQIRHLHPGAKTPSQTASVNGDKLPQS